MFLFLFIFWQFFRSLWCSNWVKYVKIFINTIDKMAKNTADKLFGYLENIFKLNIQPKYPCRLFIEPQYGIANAVMALTDTFFWWITKTSYLNPALISLKLNEKFAAKLTDSWAWLYWFSSTIRIPNDIGNIFLNIWQKKFLCFPTFLSKSANKLQVGYLRYFHTIP